MGRQVPTYPQETEPNEGGESSEGEHEIPIEGKRRTTPIMVERQRNQEELVGVPAEQEGRRDQTTNEEQLPGRRKQLGREEVPDAWKTTGNTSNGGTRVTHGTHTHHGR